MDIDSLAQALFGSKRAETQEVSTDGTTRTYAGVALTDSEDGTVVIDLGGDVTLPDDLYDEDGNVVAEWDGVGVEMPTSPQVSAGDDVIVTLMGGSATKTPMVTSSAGSGDRMRTLVNAAKTVADAAQAVADAVNQHFWHDDNGAHVTMATQDEWEQSQTGPNSLWNALGMLFRDGLSNLLALLASSVATEYFTVGDYDEYQTYYPTGQVQTILSVKAGGVEVPKYVDGTSSDSAYYTDNGTYISLSLEAETQYAGEPLEITYLTPSAMAFFDGLGNDASNVIASFSSLGATIGYEGSGHTVVDAHGMHVYTGASSTPSMEVDADGMSVSGANGTMYFNVNNTYEVPRITCAAGVQMMNGFYQQMGTFYPIAGFLVDPTGYDGATIAGSSLKLLHFDTDTMTVNQATVPMERAIVALRSPVGTYTGANNTGTASSNGWQLTYFDVVVAEHGSPRAYDYTFSNGVLTAKRDCVLEISGVMNWTDEIAGRRGFGVFEGATVGSGTEHSAFQSFEASLAGNRKSVVFPPKVFALSAGSSLTFGRNQQQNAVYQNGYNFSWVTIRVVG